MKSQLIKHIGILVSAALSFTAVSTIILSSDKPVQEVNAATDTWTNNGYQSDEYKYYSGTYYNATNVGDSAVSTGGTTLLSKLNDLIQPSNAYGYANIWTFNEQYDCYPSDYDGTDSLTGNTYPTTDNTSKRGKMWDMYSDKTWTGSSQRAGNYSVVGDKYNREHSMPKSWFGGSESNQPGTDPNHLFNTDGKVNGLRSNFAFGEVSSANKTWTNGISGASATPFGLLGNSKTSGMTSVTVYEPNDAYKGDFARAQMYMATAYYDWNLTQDTNGGYCFTYSNNVSTMKAYYINLLTKWSNQDPVSQKEIDRNNAVYSKQGNRNPFIDHPGWANKIWGGTEYTWGKSSSTPTVNSVTVTPETLSLNLAGTTTGQLTATVSVSGGAAQTVNWSSSNTNVATVSSSGLVTAKAVGTTTITAKSTVDTTKSDTCTVTVSNTVTPTISVSASSSSIAVNGTSKLTATTTNVTSPTITWSVTSGSSYVTLSSTSGSSITVTGKAAGSATIKASMTVSGTTYSDNATIEVTSAPTGGSYTIEFSGTGTTSDGSTAIGAANMLNESNITDNTLVSSCTSSSRVYLGKQSLGLKFSSGSSSGSFSLTIKDAAKTNISKIKIVTSKYGSDNCTFTLSGGSSLSETFQSTAGLDKTYSTPISVESISISAVNRGYLKSITFTIGSSPAEKTLTSISLDTANVQTSFIINSTFNYTGLIVTANYSDGSDATVTPTSVSSPSMTTGGQKTVTVTYTEEDVTKDNSYNIYVISSISASVSKTYIVGETITASDITVKDNFNNELSGFTFSDYQFVYGDAASGGALTNKTFTNGVTYETLSCSLTVQVQRQAHSSVESVTDTITAADLAATETKYIDFSDVEISSDARYAGNSAKNGDNMQFKSKDNVSGIVSTTSGGMITSVTINVASGSNTIDVYGKNSAYTAATDLYNTSSQGTVIGSTSSTGTITFTGSYQYVGIRSRSGAIYISSIEITYGGGETPTNVANYIMYEDANGQCETKFDVAKGYFESMSAADRATFMTSTDYVISQGRERFMDWAKHHGKSIVYNNGDYVISGAGYFTPGMFSISESNYIAIIIIITTISVASIGGYLALRRRKEQ